MTQALSIVGTPDNDNAISLAAAYYANSLGRHILAQNPQAKRAFQLWKQETDATSLTSALEKNQELKDLLLNETPWVLDADNETEQKQRMGDFFDENLMQNRLQQSLDKLRKLQRNNGAWSWWPEMPGSFYMTVSISEMLVRLNAMTGPNNETAQMLNTAFKFMGREIIDMVKERITREDCRNGFLLDGFPRTVVQAEALAEATDVDFAVNIDVPSERLVARISGRRMCPGCGAAYHVTTYSEPTCRKCGGTLYQRDDDREETVANRLKVYTEKTAPLIAFYEAKGKLFTVNGDADVDTVTESILKGLGA